MIDTQNPIFVLWRDNARHMSNEALEDQMDKLMDAMEELRKNAAHIAPHTGGSTMDLVRHTFNALNAEYVARGLHRQ